MTAVNLVRLLQDGGKRKTQDLQSREFSIPILAQKLTKTDAPCVNTSPHPLDEIDDVHAHARVTPAQNHFQMCHAFISHIDGA